MSSSGSLLADDEVVKNLHIGTCIDVAPYCHARRVATAVIPLGPELTAVRTQYVEASTVILDVYARRLIQLNILPHNTGNLSKGRVVMLYKEYQNKDRGSRHPQHNWIMKDFTVLISLYHGLELLLKHGMRVFLNFFDEHPEKSWIQSDDQLTVLLERLRDDLGVNPLSLNTSLLPDGTVPEVPKDLRFGHPKFDKLREIMLDHFTRAKKEGQETKAIVPRERVPSAVSAAAVSPADPAHDVRGQGAGGKSGKAVSQKQQLSIARGFREGVYNTLAATCVAEEGLHVGSVDLIVCFDISTSEPVRLVQRCGRTGRQRLGQVHILVTEGREHQTLQDCMRQRDGLNRKILQSKEIQSNLYKLNPRMMPRDFMPECRKMFITVEKKADPKEKAKEIPLKGKKGQKDLRSMLLDKNQNASSSGSNTSVKASNTNALITKEEFEEMFPEGLKKKSFEKVGREYWNLDKDTLTKLSTTDEHATKLSTWLEWQRRPQNTVNYGHSRDSEILSELLQYADAKRFEDAPSTQNPVFDTQDIVTQNIPAPSPVKVAVNPLPMKPPTKKKTKAAIVKPIVNKPIGPKDGDIRALFSTATKSTKNYTKLISDLGIPNDGSVPTSLIDLMVDLSLESTNNTVRKCYICAYVCECSFFNDMKKVKKDKLAVPSFLKKPILPDIDLLDDIDADIIEECAKKPDIVNLELNEILVDKNRDNESLDFDDNHIELLVNEKNNCSTNFDLEFDFESPVEEVNNDVHNESADKNFDIGNIEDIFADSSPEEAIEKELVKEDKNSSNPKDALGFFGLDSIEDIFADSDDSIQSVNNVVTETDTKPITKDNNAPKEVIDEVKIFDNFDVPAPIEYPASPSILSGRRKKNISTSPILCSQAKRIKLSTKKDSHSTPILKPKSLSEVFNNEEVIEIMEDNNNKLKQNTCSTTKETSIVNTSNKSMFTITQLVEMINKTQADNSKQEPSISKEDEILLTQLQQQDNERSMSPILLTQADKKRSSSKKKTKNLQIRKNHSLIVLDSDSDTDNDIDNTQVYDVDKSENIGTLLDEPKEKLLPNSPGSKRKFEVDISDDLNASPYFNKKAKLDENVPKPLSLQEKIIAALSTKKTKKLSPKKVESINFMYSSPMIGSQKENLSPKVLRNGLQSPNKDEKKETLNGLDKLQHFKHDPQNTFFE
ncbi:unnamed protein product [Plutella xylostella]|uniref:(diamondback moth) hypothetical protein n=1 Tax=Plutella xylostella TaxID=51655 RepID=A0A8S4G8Y0_PLUXY|nr:unnamed protein product [Plutella xylostella]